MSRYNEPEVQRERIRGKRARAALREIKRWEAEERNARTPYNRRRSWRQQAGGKS